MGRRLLLKRQGRLMTTNPDPKVRRAYNRSRRERVIARKRAYAQEYPERHLIAGARKRAKESGITFTITEQDIAIPIFCPVLGVELLVKPTMVDRDHAASIDRIDSQKGYVPGNVVVISHRANRMKNDASLQELEALVKWLRRIKRKQSSGRE